ncbi:MAG: hypothetical protein M2R45_03439 [Verrucomicrobia subdivision 3 bacterium]|nr:hypothetical protein [Limisphaerales bacterium]
MEHSFPGRQIQEETAWLEPPLNEGENLALLAGDEAEFSEQPFLSLPSRPASFAGADLFCGGGGVRRGQRAFCRSSKS